MARRTAYRRVLQAGPPASSMGGMAEVATLLYESPVTARRGYAAPMLDSGGGRGRAGYRRFPAAAATVAAGHYDLRHLHVASGGQRGA